MSLPPSKCPYCEAEMPFSFYAAAHWRDSLIAKCQNTACGKQYTTLMGVSRKMRQPKDDKPTDQ
jgi:hypothetical protein